MSCILLCNLPIQAHEIYTPSSNSRDLEQESMAPKPTPTTFLPQFDTFLCLFSFFPFAHSTISIFFQSVSWSSSMSPPDTF